MSHKVALTAAACLLPLAQAMAEPWFEVEVFLFERKQPSIENWPETYRLPAFAKGRDLISPVLSQPQTSGLVDCEGNFAHHSAMSPQQCDGETPDNSESGSCTGSIQHATNVIQTAQADIRPCEPQRQTMASFIPPPAAMPVTIAAGGPVNAVSADGAVLMDASHLQLTAIAKQISREQGVKPLLHLSWQQEMLPRHTSVPLRIYGGENLADRFLLTGALRPPQLPHSVRESLANANAADLTPEPVRQSDAPLSVPIRTASGELLLPGFDHGDENTQATSLDNSQSARETAADNAIPPEDSQIDWPEPVWELDGLLNIYLSHYLYVETDLVLRTPGTRKVPLDGAFLSDPQTADQPSSNTFESVSEDLSTEQLLPFEQTTLAEQPFLYAIGLKQNRRVRSGEIHYIDHPKLGMLIQIRKMAQPEESTDTPLVNKGASFVSAQN